MLGSCLDMLPDSSSLLECTFIVTMYVVLKFVNREKFCHECGEDVYCHCS